MNFTPFWETMTTIGTAIVAVAIIALLVSKKSDTGNIISDIGHAFSGALAVAEGPVTGYTPSSSAMGYSGI